MSSFEQFDRIAICGGPRVGKTTLAQAFSNHELVSTDEFIGLPWEQVPFALIAKCSTLERFVIEGVQVARALRKGLVVDAVIYLTAPRAPRTPRQVGMAKGIDKVFTDWLAQGHMVPVFRL